MKPSSFKKVLIGPSTFAAIDHEPMNRLVTSGLTVIDNPYKRKLTRDELFELLKDDVTGLIAGLEDLDREVLERSSLKVISRCGSGLSNVDLSAAKELGIKVYFTPDAPVNAVAELTLGAMLSLLRMIPHMDKDLHEGKWTKKIGYQLTGKTITIIGFGRIGRCLTYLLSPFRTKILAVDPYLKEPVDNVMVMNLEEALPLADIITIHSSGESCIMDRKRFELVKTGALILNAARGSLIDENALMYAIDNGKIAGAWIDTFKNEPYTGPLIRYPQVILTPHIGSYTRECRKLMETEAVNNLITGLIGENA
jgi:D-3-phosphoglycerate dehydrogenase